MILVYVKVVLFSNISNVKFYSSMKSNEPYYCDTLNSNNCQIRGYTTVLFI